MCSQSSKPRSLIANLLAGPPSLASLHLGRDGSIINHLSMGASEGASALRSLSPLGTSLHLRASYPSSRPSRLDHPAVAAGRAMAGSGYSFCHLFIYFWQMLHTHTHTYSSCSHSFTSQNFISFSLVMAKKLGGIVWYSLTDCILTSLSLCIRTDARTVSSGSSAWEGQLNSIVLSEYASTEMSIHALYMHEVKQMSKRALFLKHYYSSTHSYNLIHACSNPLNSLL